MNVITVRWGNKYSEDYVYALKAQVPQLKVLTVETGDLREPMRFHSWFSKLEVFRPENRHFRPCLFIDLDTFVIGSLAPFFKLDDTKLWLIRDLFQPEKRSNSGLFIAPEYGISDTIWERAQSLDMSRGGDGDFLNSFEHEKLQDYVSGILSYKAHQLYEGPKNARIVCFHGRPKPADTDGWAQEHWQSCLKDSAMLNL